MMQRKYIILFLKLLIFCSVMIFSCVEGPNLPTEIYREWKGKIVYTSDEDGDYDIYVMNADGSEVKKLTNNNDRDYSPVWSPDGNRITFSSYRNGIGGIYIMDSSGENERNISNYPNANDYDPYWSPDGNKIVFCSVYDGDLDIFTMNADGTNVQKLVDSSVHEWSPTWSPDGTKIAFNSEMAIAEGGTDMIFIYDFTLDSLYNITPDAKYAYYEPAWSPDGKMIACDVLFIEGLRMHIGLIDIKTGEIEIRSLLGEYREWSNLWFRSSLCWSPDGSMIAFIAADPEKDYNLDIYTMYIDFSNIQRISSSIADEQYPSWH
jgi:TolB protein